ncbi:SusD/RagB family nutrient-binding outer membrane lipoprotein, partial [Ornithobacterium rhinotracheale]|uniref:SusD/RagB family nutrient-binding outer membrane lipoprotein n=1 Tax=Ornithobacterium rhinotracheale TaxID=28251 RepID=UPI00403607D3
MSADIAKGNKENHKTDFEEINIDPLAANIDQVQTEYFINNSIIGTQQNPHIAERVFILYWKAAGRMDRINTLPIGVSNDDWTRDYYDYLAGWQTNVNTAIKVAENLEKQGKAEDYVKNLKQVARIWRVYLLSEGVDNFGPYPISKFDGSNPEFSSVEEVYKFMLKELKEASETMIDNVNVEDRVAKLDPAYRYDFDKWKRYANSMRMRLSMRISEVSPDIAKQNFEDAAKSNKFIESLSQNFQVEEKPGWSDLTGVMSREWNNQYLSSTANNLYIGLGGIKSSELLSNYSQDLKNYIKPENYLGVKYDKHFATKTNDPSAGFWFDGLHYSMDPRAYKAYPIPGNFEDPQFNYYPSWSKKNVTETKRTLINVEDKKVLKEINAKYTWNTYSLGDWGEKAAIN